MHAKGVLRCGSDAAPQTGKSARRPADASDEWTRGIYKRANVESPQECFFVELCRSETTLEVKVVGGVETSDHLVKRHTPSSVPVLGARDSQIKDQVCQCCKLSGSCAQMLLQLLSLPKQKFHATSYVLLATAHAVSLHQNSEHACCALQQSTRNAGTCNRGI